MRLRSKIRELKQQHAHLQEMKQAQQQQLQASMHTPSTPTLPLNQLQALMHQPDSQCTVGQAAFCQQANTQQDSETQHDSKTQHDDFSESRPAELTAVESAYEAMSETTSDTDCSDSEESSSDS